MIWSNGFMLELRKLGLALNKTRKPVMLEVGLELLTWVVIRIILACYNSHSFNNINAKNH